MREGCEIRICLSVSLLDTASPWVQIFFMVFHLLVAYHRVECGHDIHDTPRQCRCFHRKG